jgi:hypothetical protein
MVQLENGGRLSRSFSSDKQQVKAGILSSASFSVLLVTSERMMGVADRYTDGLTRTTIKTGTLDHFV